MTSMCKVDTCCTDRVSDIMCGERMPVFVDISDWMASVNSNAVASVDWCAAPSSCHDAADLIITDPKFDNGALYVTANLSGGEAGVMYRVDLEIETCEGHRGRFCFTQYIKNC